MVVDTYNIFVNDDQIYKPYTSVIYDEGNGGKKKVDDIVDVKFLLEKMIMDLLFIGDGILFLH